MAVGVEVAAEFRAGSVSSCGRGVYRRSSVVDSIFFGDFSGHADGERRGLDRVGG